MTKNAVLQLNGTSRFYTGRGWSDEYPDALKLTKEQAKYMIRSARRTLNAGRGAIEGLTREQQLISDANVITDYGTEDEATILVA